MQHHLDSVQVKKQLNQMARLHRTFEVPVITEEDEYLESESPKLKYDQD